MRASDVLEARDELTSIVLASTSEGNSVDVESAKQIAEALLSNNLIDVPAMLRSAGGFTVGVQVTLDGDISGSGIIVQVDDSDDVRPFHVYINDTGQSYWAKPDEVTLR